MKIKAHLENEGYEVGSYDQEYKFYRFNDGVTHGIFYISDDGSCWIINYYDPEAYSSGTRKMKPTRTTMSLKAHSSPLNNTQSNFKASSYKVAGSSFSSLRISDL